MGTIADKLTYLDGTKQALKESINNLGGDITSETTFREYAQELQDIYDNIPKTTGEGTNLSLNTIKGKMNIIPKGDTQQDGTPTPSTPIDIEVVTGTQEVKVENVNLFNGTLYKGQVLGDGNINPSPANRVTNTQTATGSITYLKVGTYTISAPNLDYCSLLTKNASGTILQNFANQWNALPFNFTLTQSGYVYFTLRNENNTDLTPSECSAQIEKGSTSTAYVEHQEQTQTISLGDIELCKIGNYQDYLYKSGDKWYKKALIGKHIFTGASDENWQVTGTGTNKWFYNISNFNTDLLISYTDGNSNAKSNYYISTNVVSSNTSEGFYIGGNSTTHLGFLRVRYGTEDTPANYKTWLSTHNLEVRYILYEPKDIEITNTNLIEQLNNLEKAQSYNGTTNISSNGNLPFVLGVSALKGE